MLRSSLERSSGLPIEESVVDRTLRRQADDISLPLRAQHWSALEKVRETKAPVEDDPDLWNGLLRDLFVLEYEDGQGRWYDWNPLLAESPRGPERSLVMPAKLSEVSLSVENRVELTALCNMLELASGFTLGFVRVNHSGLRERLVDEIRRRRPQMQIQEIQLDRQSRAGVVAQLEDRLGDAHPGALFVHGLEGMFDPSLEQSPKLDILNLNRDFFAKRFPWPVVFWVPEFAMREFSRQAPDFWSWRSGTYHFVGQEGDAGETLAAVARRRCLEYRPARESARGVRFLSTSRLS